MLDIYLQNPLLAGGSVFILGLCIGSFLNVVVYRLPIMLERQWKREARDILELATADEGPAFSLSTPRSRCPHCGHYITAAENIPLLSWAVLRGRCSECRKPISPRYPLVELATGLISLLVLVVLGPTPQMLVALPLSWALIALTLIDFDTQLLPDDITLPLVWAGLLVNMSSLFVPLPEALIGAMAGYLSLWSIFWLFKLLTGKEGMGYGDFKLLAALGAWLGWHQLPLIILMSSVVGVIAGLGYMAVRRQNLAFAYGPYLAIAGFIAMLWGQPLMQWYLQLGH
jgi:leader peptidase (prepilin peptidase)/N-methyltransferase